MDKKIKTDNKQLSSLSLSLGTIQAYKDKKTRSIKQPLNQKSISLTSNKHWRWMGNNNSNNNNKQQPLHSGVLYGIARLEDPHYREERHKLTVSGLGEPPINRQSLEHLFSFLDDRDSHKVTELVLTFVQLVSHPSPDGGVNVLRDFFSRSDTSLTKVTLRDCNLGSREDASQLLAAFHTNRTVTDLTIHDTKNLEGAALGNCLSGLLQNMPQLQRLACYYSSLRLEGVRAFQPALQANRTLRELSLTTCELGDEGIHLVADALVGNSIMEVLDIRWNGITANGLDDITRLLESTQLKTIDIGGNRGVFDNEASTQRFTRILSRHEFLKELNLSNLQLGDEGICLIVDGLVGNRILGLLDIGWNDITSVGLADIARLLESTQLKTITLWGNREIFNDEDATQHFVSTLQHKWSNVQELPGIHEEYFPRDSRAAAYASINNSLTRNKQLNHVNLLLAPPPPQQQQNHHGGAALMMFKTWHKAITKFAIVPDNAGASAIFKLFQARPALLEKRLKRPAAPSSGSRQQEDSSSHDVGNDSKPGGGATDMKSLDGRKRRRL